MLTRYKFSLIVLLCCYLSALADDNVAIQSNLLTQSLLLDIKRLSEKKLVVVGERGHIAVSSDNGTSWEQAQVPTRATLTAVYFHDQQLGWAVGHDATVLRSRDGGTHWSRIYYAPDKQQPLLDVWFRDASYGIAIGAYGYLLMTNDGGDSWQERTVSDDDFHLNQIRVSANDKLYIAAEAGNIYRSDDHGITWRALPSPYEGSFFGILPLGKDSLLLFGLRGHIFRSNDMGESWQSVSGQSIAMLTSAIKLGGSEVVLVGSSGEILLSEDQGHTFIRRTLEGRMSISSVVALGVKQQLLLAGDQGIKKLTVK